MTVVYFEERGRGGKVCCRLSSVSVQTDWGRVLVKREVGSRDGAREAGSRCPPRAGLKRALVAAGESCIHWEYIGYVRIYKALLK